MGTYHGMSLKSVTEGNQPQKKTQTIPTLSKYYMLIIRYYPDRYAMLIEYY